MPPSGGLPLLLPGRTAYGCPVIDLAAILDGPVTWSVEIADNRQVLARHAPDLVLPVASAGKLLLLCALSEQIDTGAIDPAQSLTKADLAPVHDSGIWQHLGEERLRIDSLAFLVGSASDNLATNALIDVLGLEALAATAQRMRTRHTAVHDRVRDVRDPATDAPTFASGTAADLVSLWQTLRSGHLLGPRASARVLRWLAHGTDHSMVLAPFGLDPLSHGYDRSTRVWHKTGSDPGTRADCGIVERGDAWVAYAAIARWDPAQVSDLQVLGTMAELGHLIASHLGSRTVSRSAPRIFHIAARSDWEDAQADGVYTWSTRGRTLDEQGFIHLSTAAQWPRVWDAVYGNAPEPHVLLEVDPALAGLSVRYEPGEPGGREDFPHLYGPLPTKAVVAVHPLPVQPPAAATA